MNKLKQTPLNFLRCNIRIFPSLPPQLPFQLAIVRRDRISNYYSLVHGQHSMNLCLRTCYRNFSSKQDTLNSEQTDRNVEQKNEQDQKQNKDDLKVIEGFLDQASTHIQDENPKKAIEVCEQALQMSTRVYPNQDHQTISRALHLISKACLLMENYEEALTYSQKVYQMNKRLYSDQDHQRISQNLNNMGEACTELRKLEEAEQYLKEAYEMSMRLNSDRAHPETTKILKNLGELFSAKGEIIAMHYWATAYHMIKELPPDQIDQEVAENVCRLGDALCYLTVREGAFKCWEEYYEMLKKMLSDQDHPRVVKILKNMGSVMNKLGKREEAKHYEQKADDMEKRLSSHS